MKELTIEEKAKRYDQAIERAKDQSNKCCLDKIVLEEIFPELKDSEDERMMNQLHSWMKEFGGAEEYTEKVYQWIKGLLEKQGENNMGISEATKQKLEDNLNKALEKETPESWSEFLDEQKPADKKGMNLVEEKMTPFQKKVFCIIDTTIEEEQGLKQVCDELLALAKHEIEQKPAEWSIFDYRTWQYIVSDVLTKKEGIGQYLDDGTCKNIAKYMQEEWSKRLSIELPKGQDYGIDGLYAAIDILTKTVGEVCGYQSDDGILAHKCAISAVKELSKQKPAWSEEDESRRKKIIHILSLDGRIKNEELSDINNWLKSIRPQSQWKPSEEQLKSLKEVIDVGHFTSYPNALETLYEQLKKLREE